MTSPYRVPYNRPYVAGSEPRYVAEAIASRWSGGDGPFTKQVTLLVEKLTGASCALLTTSCTHALELAALLLDLKPGDEVIMPSYTFTSTANACVLRGAVPVFVDIRPDTLNLDETLVEQAITGRTRAIFVVHYAGVGCEMDTILAIAERHGLAVVEDNAHGLGGSYRGRPLGSLGALATQSFHATKNVQCGEGGALLVNDTGLIGRAEIIREKGTDRTSFNRGDIDKYRWQDLGSSYLPSDLLAAYLLGQLEAFGDIQEQRGRVWTAYHRSLRSWADREGVQLPSVPAHCVHPAHLYPVVFPDAASRNTFVRHLAERGVQATPHYQPLHSAPAGQRHGRVAPGGCPVTDRVADRLVRLPLFAGMTETDIEHVISSSVAYTSSPVSTAGSS